MSKKVIAIIVAIFIAVTAILGVSIYKDLNLKPENKNTETEAGEQVIEGELLFELSYDDGNQDTPTTTTIQFYSD